MHLGTNSRTLWLGVPRPSHVSVVTSVLLGWTLPGCKTRTHNETGTKASSREGFVVPAGPGLGEAGEREEPDEAARIARMADLTVELQKVIRAREGQPSDALKRDAHTKAHGCARGVFEVDPALPRELQTGVFQAGVRYPVWVRLSNGAPGTGPDKEPTSRGFAMKLLDVEKRLASAGRTLPQDEAAWLLEGRASFGQDFTFLNHRQFIAKDLKTYIAFSEGLSEGRPLSGFVNLDPRHPRLKPIQAKTLLETVLMPVSNPVDISYFGQVPYKFKTTAAKWRLDRCASSAKPSRLDSASPPDALHHAFARALRDGDVCYDFSIILQKDPVAQPLEDSHVEWPSDDDDIRAGRAFANRTRVARLLLPRQEVPHPSTDTRCEAMSFSPWHSLAAHKPLGSMGRARKAIYLAGAGARPSAPVGDGVDAEHEALIAGPSVFEPPQDDTRP